MGDKNSYMLGNIIVDQINKTRNYPLASAFSILITLISMGAILWMLLANKNEASLKKSTAREDAALTPVISQSAATLDSANNQ